MTVRTGLMVVSLLASVAIGLLLARGRAGEGAGPADAAGRSAGRHAPLIGLSLDTLKEARWQHDRDLFVARAKELGAEVLVQAANSDDARQVGDVEALLSRHVDVLVVVPHDGRALGPAVERAHGSGVPVIAYDRMVRDADLDLYLSFDNVRVGRLQGEFVVEKARAAGATRQKPFRIVRIYGSRTDNNAAMFKQGQDEALGPALAQGLVTVVHEDWAEDWKPENGKKIVNAAITRAGKTIDAVLASNDGTAGGAVQALTEEGLAGKVLVTGQDADLVACQRIVAGTQSMTVYKPLAVLARRAAEVAVAMAARKPVVARDAVPNGKLDVPAILADVITVTRDNLESTVIKDGFHSAKAIGL